MTIASPLRDKTVALAVSGSIAAYKAANLVRELRRAGAEVRVSMTREAAEFVAPLTFEALSEHPVEIDPFRSGESIRHIALAREADLLLIAPATAHLIARLALGLADDAPTALALACRAPLIIAPAMNSGMWQHPATQENIRTLQQRGAQIIEPDQGELACGEQGPGRLPDAELIVAAVERLLRPPSPRWQGRRVLVTAGGTEEAIDAVRVLSNRSSGRMGMALARAAQDLGARVELILARHSVAVPAELEVHHARSVEAMREAVLEAMPRTDLLIMAAAVSDFKPLRPAVKKIKREQGTLTIELEPTADILSQVSKGRRPGQILVGFALEDEEGEAEACRKLETKGLDLIVLNHPEVALDTTHNQVTIFSAKGESWRLEAAPKDEIARAILARIEDLLR